MQAEHVNCGTCPYAMREKTGLRCGHRPENVYLHDWPVTRFPAVSPEQHCSQHPFMPKLIETRLAFFETPKEN